MITAVATPVMTTEEMRERVQRGADWLDSQRAGWAQDVNPSTLNMSSVYYCVLGQLYGSFERVFFLTGIGDDHLAKLVWARRHGFMIEFLCSNMVPLFERLDMCWQEEISRRRP